MKQKRWILNGVMGRQRYATSIILRSYARMEIQDALNFSKINVKLKNMSLLLSKTKIQCGNNSQDFTGAKVQQTR